MQNSDIYYTIQSKQSQEIKIKGSRFIATAIPVSDKEQAIEERKKISNIYYNATHNPYAYRIGASGLEYRFSDDGEPSGTAGKPILLAIQKHNLSDIIIIVTRYFGGIKLGAGGLSRAYFESANAVIEQCSKKEISLTIEVKIFSLYEDYKNINKLISEFALSSNENFRDIVEINALIPQTKIDEFERRLIDISRGRAGLKIE